MKKKSKTLMKKKLVIQPRLVKDQIIYVRLNDGDVRQIDDLRKELGVATRSEMIRTLVVEAMKNVEVG